MISSSYELMDLTVMIIRPSDSNNREDRPKNDH